MPKKTVLYIEDSPANLALMEQYFEGLDDLELISAITAEEGLEMVRKSHPDLILMDIHLPGMNGIEALEELRSAEETHHIPVFAISADAMPDDVQHALDCGFDAYVTKPIKLLELLDLMHKHLDVE